jgi:DNA repair exonuclease SbcCD nuclease subunit
MKIAHIADVHFRSLSRHDEYKKIFEKFLDEITKKEVEHVFVAGDIFHTKTMGISPEFIQLFTWWASSISSIAKLHMMLGNHDGNLMNLSRQDAISPLVFAMNNNIKNSEKRIFLYKESGVYEFEDGWNWCIFSLFDQNNWQNVKPIPGKINIACYHGGVLGCVTETGYELEDHEGIIKTDFFDGYDFVFLGDIHKRQSLGYRKTKLIIKKDDLSKYKYFNPTIINK